MAKQAITKFLIKFTSAGNDYYVKSNKGSVGFSYAKGRSTATKYDQTVAKQLVSFLSATEGITNVGAVPAKEEVYPEFWEILGPEVLKLALS